MNSVQFIQCLETERTKSICIAGMEGYIESVNEETKEYRVIVYDLVGPCGPFVLNETGLHLIGEEEFKALRKRYS